MSEPEKESTEELIAVALVIETKRLRALNAELLKVVEKIVSLDAIPNCDHLKKTPGFRAAIESAREAIANARRAPW